MSQDIRRLGIFFGLASLLSLLLSLQSAIFKTDFHLPKEKAAVGAVLATESLCKNIAGSVKFLPRGFSSACDSLVSPSVDLLVNESLTFSIGNVTDDYTWEQCRNDTPQDFEGKFNGANIPESALERCVKLSIANLNGIRLGETRILGVLGDLFAHEEYVLFGTILFFGILFPFFKALALLGSAIMWNSGSTRSLEIAGLAGKWSMTDVFVVSVMIVNVKMNALGLEIKSSWGLWFLLASGLMSSLGIQLIAKHAVTKFHSDENLNELS